MLQTAFFARDVSAAVMISQLPAKRDRGWGRRRQAYPKGQHYRFVPKVCNASVITDWVSEIQYMNQQSVVGKKALWQGACRTTHPS